MHMSRQPLLICQVNVNPGVSRYVLVWRVPPPTTGTLFKVVISSCFPSERFDLYSVADAP